MLRSAAAAVTAAALIIVGSLGSPAPAQALTGCKLAVSSPSTLLVAQSVTPTTLSVTATSLTCGAPTRWTVIIALPGKDLFKEVVKHSPGTSTQTIDILVGTSNLKNGKAVAGTKYQVKVIARLSDGSSVQSATKRIVFQQDTKVSLAASSSGKGKLKVSGTLKRYDWMKSQWLTMPKKTLEVLLDGADLPGVKTDSKGKFSRSYTHLASGEATLGAFFWPTSSYDKAYTSTTVSIR